MQITPALLMPSAARRALSEIMHDVKEAQEAITEVLDDEKALAGICLSEREPDEALPEGRQPPSVRLAAALLSSYERQIQSVEGALRVCALRTPHSADTFTMPTVIPAMAHLSNKARWFEVVRHMLSRAISGLRTLLK